MTAATNTKPVAPKTIPPLPADLDAALRRLKLATVRRNATLLSMARDEYRRQTARCCERLTLTTYADYIQ